MPVLGRSIAKKIGSHVPLSSVGMEDSHPEEVFLVAKTGEFFTSYEAYLERLELYYQSIWTCKLTGHTGMTYFEALESERNALEGLEKFPEWWKPYILFSIHGAIESIDTLASRMINYCRTFLALNEPVQVPFNGTFYNGIISSAPRYDFDKVPNDQNEEYRIYINDRNLIMTAACTGPQDIKRIFPPPNKALIKKFIRFASTRYGHAGMPLLVNDDLLKKYQIQKEIDPELLERVERIRKIQTTPKVEPQPVKEDEFIKYPILDEFVPIDLQKSPQLWPIPKEFSRKLSVVNENLIGDAISFWVFIHTFGKILAISPCSLNIFLSSLEFMDEPNPLMEAIFCSFLDQLGKVLRSPKTKEEKVLQHGKIGGDISDPVSFFKSQVMEGEMSLPSDEVLELFISKVNKKLKRERKWYFQIIELLWEIREIPTVRHLLGSLEGQENFIFDSSGSTKLKILLALRDFYLTCVTVKPVVDKEIEFLSQSKQRIRELEIERRKVIKDGQELLTEQEKLEAKIGGEGVNATELRELKKLSRSIEMKVSKSVKTEERLTNEIDRVKNSQLEHSLVRVKPIGEDRFGRLYWFLDGHLVRPSTKPHNSGILLVEDGKKWSFYDEEEEIEKLILSLNPFGVREAQFKDNLTSIKETILKTLSPFPHGDIIRETGEEVINGTNHNKENDIESSSDEEPVVVIRRRAAVKRRIMDDLPEFLRYRNSFKKAK